MYTITNVRTFTGREGYGLNAVIRDAAGAPVAFALDQGDGGEPRLDFRNPMQTPASAAKVETTWRAAQALFHEWALSGECPGSFDERFASLYPTREARAEARAWDWINRDVDAQQNKKRLDRAAKTKTLYRLPGDGEDAWRTLSVPYTDPRAKAHLDQKYPGQQIVIYGQPGGGT
jgi:hypothetical protein